MIYDTNEVDNVRICKNCEANIEIPKSLPCGEAICSHCESSIRVNNNKFECPLCVKIHEMPLDGLPVCKPLLAMLSLKPIKLSRGKVFDTLENNLDVIKKKRNYIKLGLNDNNDIVREHFMHLKNEVQLAAEEASLQIGDSTSQLIEELDEYEKELIQFNKSNLRTLAGFNHTVDDLESFLTTNTKYLERFDINYEEVAKKNEQAADLIQKADQKIEKLKDLIFDGQIINFEKNTNKIDKSILGVTSLNNKILDSLIITDQIKLNQFSNICEFSLKQKWTLIYRASRDGFKADNFHSKCDDKPKTLVIIKSTNGNVFGGYTEQSWSSPSNDVDILDTKAFIFSLINQDNRPLKIKCSPNNGIGCNKDWGPMFGGKNGKSDIVIADASNLNSESFSHFGHYFKHPDYVYRSNKANSFLAGSYKFRVAEIEVYLKQ